MLLLVSNLLRQCVNKRSQSGQTRLEQRENCKREVFETFLESRLLSLCVGAFFNSPWNTLLHNSVQNMLSEALSLHGDEALVRAKGPESDLPRSSGESRDTSAVRYSEVEVLSRSSSRPMRFQGGTHIQVCASLELRMRCSSLQLGSSARRWCGSWRRRSSRGRLRGSSRSRSRRARAPGTPSAWGPRPRQ